MEQERIEVMIGDRVVELTYDSAYELALQIFRWIENQEENEFH